MDKTPNRNKTSQSAIMAERPSLEKRVLLLSPTLRDAELSCAILTEAGLTCTVCADAEECSRELLQGVGALLIAENMLLAEGEQQLVNTLGKQSAWSDLPVIMLTRGGAADSPRLASMMKALGNVTLLEMPVRISTLLSALQTALRARARQYQIRDQMIEQQKAEAALRDADRLKDEFLAMLAHELRNPLAPIRNAAQVLRLAAPQEAILQRQRDIIDRQVTHMARLLDDLLDVSRVTRGNVHLKKEPVRLTDVLARAVETANPLIEARQHTLIVTPTSVSLKVVGDFDRLIQIVGNLLNNAAKYTEAGGTIWLEAALAGGEVVIRVRDTGVGIAPEMLPRVFDVFTQVERSLDRSQGGLGLGLTLVKNLVQMHGGRVEAHSAGLGQGSEFVVRLPALSEPPGLEQQAAEDVAHAEANPRRILVVDDVADTANSLAELLGLLGHEVKAAYDGPSAITVARDYHPEVILLDIGLPGTNGFEVARQIRRDPDLRNVFLVALTGYGQEEDRRQAQAAGFNEHLTKPVDLEQLHALIRRLSR